MDESKIFDAIEFAARARRDRYRKDSKLPYMAHLMGVCKVLIEHGRRFPQESGRQ